MGAIGNLTWKTSQQKILDYIFRNSDDVNKTSHDWSYDEDTQRNIMSQIRDLINKYGFTESQVAAILNGYKESTIWDSTNVPEKLLADLKEMDSWDQYIGEKPEIPNPDDLFTQAEEDLDAEYGALNNLYDSILEDDREALNNSLIENNKMFSDFRNQMLSNEAMQQQAIAGATRFELDRQQRLAISRGASAAQRLVGSINASLGMQAQSAQQALETSNVLAQNLLTHRQANEGLRNEYRMAQDDRNLRRADLINGRTERRNSLQNQYLDRAMYAYDINNERYKERLSNIQGTNPWASAYTSYRTKKDNGNSI